MSVRKNHRNLIGLGVLVVILLAAGAATYLFGGFGAEKAAPRATEVALALSADTPNARLRVGQSFTLPIDDAAGIASSDGFSTLETVFLGPDALYVVDHPPGPPGARVRWYKDGVLLGTHRAPPGSLFFAPDADGFHYLVSKYSGSSEVAVVVDRAGSVEATYVVPLKANAGGLVRNGETLFARAWESQVDPKTQIINGRDVLLPVAIKGKQATDGQASGGRVPAWALTAAGRWQHTVSGKSGSLSNVVKHNGVGTRLPSSAVLLGVDEYSRVWAILPPEALDRRGDPGWPAAADSLGLLVAFDAGGAVRGVSPLPAGVGITWPDIELSRSVGFDGQHVVVADRVEKGIRVTVLEIQR